MEDVVNILIFFLGVFFYIKGYITFSEERMRLLLLWVTVIIVILSYFLVSISVGFQKIKKEKKLIKTKKKKKGFLNEKKGEGYNERVCELCFCY